MALEKTFNVELRIRAKEEVDEISFYYENLSAGLGKRFYKEFKDTSRTLAFNPFFQLQYEDIRKIPLKSFPYSIHFRIVETEKIVFIETIMSDHLMPFSTKMKQ